MIDVTCAARSRLPTGRNVSLGELVGGLYGILPAACFWRVDVCHQLTTLAKQSRWFACPSSLWLWNSDSIDGQVMNHHLERLVLRLIPRAGIHGDAQAIAATATRRGKWTFSEPG